MKGLFITICILAISVNIFTFAMLDMPTTEFQPDQTEIELFISGDEFHSWAYMDIKGERFTAIKDRVTGYWCWAKLDKKGKLVSSGYPVHRHNPKSIGLKPNINISNESYLELREPFDKMLDTYSTRTVTKGVMNVITIFVKFLDDEDFDMPISYYEDLLNNYNATPASLKRYYSEQSYGKLIINSFFPLQNLSDSIVSYQAPFDRQYCIDHNLLDIILRNSISVCIPIIQTYLIEHNIDIDVDDNGFVDNITFIVKGQAEKPSLWSYMSNFSDPTNSNVFISGSRIGKYTVNIEGHINQRGVSVIAHEFGHTLGLPDFQGSIVDSVAVHAVQNWCLMGLVPHTNGNIKNPASILMHNKYRYCKWIDDIPTITNAGTYTLHPNYANYPNAGHERAYKIYSSHSINEYYIVEYRRKTDTASQYYDQYIDDVIWGSGMLIYKVNVTKRGNTEGADPASYELFIYRPPDPEHPEYNSITPNKYYTQAHYLADSLRTEINDATLPSGMLSDERLGGLNISNIGFVGETIDFTIAFEYNHYTVPGSFSTIQDAITEAQTGMRSFIDISGGPYYENPIIDSKDLVIRGVTPDVEIRGFFTVNRAPSQVEFSNLRFTTPSANYSINIDNSNLKINNVVFDLVNTNALGAISAISNTIRRDLIEISNTIFNGKQAINYDTRYNYELLPAKLIIDNSLFYQNIHPDPVIGNAITFKGSNITISNSKFIQNGLNVDSSTISLYFFSSVGIERTLDFYNNIFQTSIDDDAFSIVPSDILIDLTHHPLTINIERNIFNTINNLQSEVLSFAKIKFSSTADLERPNIKIINNTDIVTRSNGFALYGSYYFLKHNGNLIANNNALTGGIYWGNFTGVSTEMRNNCLVPPFATTPTYRLIYSGNISVVPQVDPLTYFPIWNSVAKSPLIDAGYAGADTTSNSWIAVPEYRDSDGTRIDIGAYPARRHKSMRYQLKASEQLGIFYTNAKHWVSFPYLDNLFQGSIDGHPANELAYNLDVYNNNNLLKLTQPRFINSIIWNYNDDQGGVSLVNGNQWAGADHILKSRYGYKISMSGEAMADIVVSGFLPSDNDALITIEPIYPPPINPADRYRDILVGYFLPHPEYPLVALKDIEKKLIMIQTKNWAISRASVNSDWIISTREPMINPGEAVELRYVGDTTSTFNWFSPFAIDEDEEDGGTGVPFYVHPKPDHYEFEEQFDYIPLFIELSEELQDDYNAEIGLFIDDVCYGAEVVVGELIQLNAYIYELDIDDDAVVELKYYKYGSKGAGKAINEYRVRDNNNKSLAEKKLNFSKKEQFYQISYKEEGEQQEDITLVKTALKGNYPNPFNPSTIIEYSLAETGKVKISVYNIKGQLVRTLVNEVIEAGHHTVIWNGTDRNAKKVSSGIYFYKMESKAGSDVKKMLLIK